MSLREGSLIFVRPCANNKVLADDPAAHVPVHHERESAKHTLLVQRMGSSQECADSFGQCLIKWHDSSTRPVARFVYFTFMQSRAVSVLLVACALALGQAKPYPKPQVPAAVDQLAPDFTLRDQQGKRFHLADQRGHWVLLFFYRGYW